FIVWGVQRLFLQHVDHFTALFIQIAIGIISYTGLLLLIRPKVYYDLLELLKRSSKPKKSIV
ncbi:MAG: hypothetical protein CUN55_08165, partial [Phototrophicales bacterium]